MRFIHSLNTRPLFINCYDVAPMRRLLGNIWYFALSMAYIKRAGAEIVLHTDSLGAALLSYLPYDEVHLTLDDLPDDIHPRFWAAGKMWALEAEQPGAVHIDGDVFLKRRALIDDIENSSWDAIVQHYESSEWYEKENVLFDRAPRVCLDRGLDTHRIGAYNTGVIGFRDAELRRRYIDTYKHIATYFSRECAELLDSDSFLTPDVIIEQRHIYQLCEATDSRVKIVLPGETGHSAIARAIGFQHVITSRKFEQLDQCRQMLQHIAPNIYNKTLRLCRNN